MKVTKVIVKVPKQSRGGKKYRILHDQKITPPVEGEQILAALKHQYDVSGFTVENGVATAFVGKKKTDEE